MHVTTELVSKRKFISHSSEDTLKAISNSLGGEYVKPSSATSKTGVIRIIRQGLEETIYYMRQEGLGRGILQVLVRPTIGPSVDSVVLRSSGVLPHATKGALDNTRLLFSSNFNAYKNKGTDITKNEHFGWSYDLDLSADFCAFDSFLTGFVAS